MNWAPLIALAPLFLIVVVFYLGTMVWTVQISFTNSQTLPVNEYVGMRMYNRLWASDRWYTSLANIGIFGILYIGGCLVVGFLLAVSIDQRIRSESGFRTVFLYPQSMSYIVTGLAWQWIMNPTLGLQKLVRDYGWDTFRLDWIANTDTAIFVVIMAGIWHTSGLIMAIFLAGLRGVDPELWKAARVDGVPPWRYYLHIVIPVLRPTVLTATVLLSIGTVRVYDLVVGLTQGGPGIATEMPAKFVMDYLFERQNIGIATAASVCMLITVLAVLSPWMYAEHIRPRLRQRRIG
jgi:glucose/mannose transport system permease protein